MHVSALDFISIIDDLGLTMTGDDIGLFVGLGVGRRDGLLVG